MTTTIDRPVTVEHLNELPEDGDRCQAFIDRGTRLLRGLIRIVRPRRCGHKASTFVTITCMVHGSTRRSLCTRHLKQLEDGKFVVCCMHCMKPALWTEGTY